MFWAATVARAFVMSGEVPMPSTPSCRSKYPEFAYSPKVYPLCYNPKPKYLTAGHGLEFRVQELRI